MKTFKKDSKFEGRKSKGPAKGRGPKRGEDFGQYEERKSGSFNRRGPRRESRTEMHKAVCDKCGKDCEVPFKPTSSKPLYCDECFKQEGGKSRGGSSKDLEEINKKLDKIMEALKIE